MDFDNDVRARLMVKTSGCGSMSISDLDYSPLWNIFVLDASGTSMIGMYPLKFMH